MANEFKTALWGQSMNPGIVLRFSPLRPPQCSRKLEDLGQFTILNKAGVHPSS
jgi:hypothetical protein